MAKRELSSTLKNLKFMQRAAQREEVAKKEEQVIPDGNFPPSGVPKKCVVIMEGDPHPGAVRGRMSFLSFNPSIDKLNEDTSRLHQSDGSVTSSGRQTEISSSRENGSPGDGLEDLKPGSSGFDPNGDTKRKQAEIFSEEQHSKKPKKNFQEYQESSPDKRRTTQKQPKREKLDWNILQPSNDRK